MGKTSKLDRARGLVHPVTRKKMSRDEMAELRMKAILQERISGTNPFPRIVGGASTQPHTSGYYTEKPYLSDPEHHAAIGVWEDLKKNELNSEDVRGRLALEHRKLELVAEQQRAQIAADQERLQIQRAEVVVRALEVAARAGVSGEQIMAVIMDGKLLSGPVEGAVEVPDALQLTDKVKVEAVAEAE